MNNNRSRDGGFFRGLITGAILGAGLYYFLTSTEEGEKVKKRLKEKGEEVFDSLTDLVEEIEEKGVEFKKKTKEIQAELEEKAKSFQQGTAEEAKGKLAQIDELRERGRQAVRSFTRNGRPLS